MWQVLLGAAIAGSGYFAKQLLYKNDGKPTNYSPLNLDLPIENAESETSILEEDASSIFRFSSTSHGSKNPRKKLGRGGGIKGARGNHERKSGVGKKIGDGLVDDQRKNGKKFTVCLKKRRIGRNTSAKCDSFDVKELPISKQTNEFRAFSLVTLTDRAKERRIRSCERSRRTNKREA
ncbi:unnamed protein product [Lactuca saligna]|uniref:Uncharacterized protein n=1 Tax=Lactuca saligna TaxID=75948 RepID=A0AA36EDA2_LACSI|nr:unnamed protein product [Lactuca saligna]